MVTTKKIPGRVRGWVAMKTWGQSYKNILALITSKLIYIAKLKFHHDLHEFWCNLDQNSFIF